MSKQIPAISGIELTKLLQKDQWLVKGYCRHGMMLQKDIGERKLITVIPQKSCSLPKGTLSDILGPRQTRIGKDGLLALIDKYGL